MKPSVFIKIGVMIFALIGVLWLAKDLQTNGIDPELLGYPEAPSEAVGVLCPHPPVRVQIYNNKLDKETVIELVGPHWVIKGTGEGTAEDFEKGLQSLCQHKTEKVVTIEGLKKKPTFQEQIRITLVNRDTLDFKMTEAGLVLFQEKYYLNSDFIRGIETIKQGRGR